MIVVGADVVGSTASNRLFLVILALIQKQPPTGVADVGEFVEIKDELERSMHLFEDEVINIQVETQGVDDGCMEVGVSHISDEVG